MLNEDEDGKSPAIRLMTIFAEDGSATLLNLQQVRTIEIRPGQCRIVYSDTHQVTITGKGADELLRYLGSISVTGSGKPLSQFLDKAVQHPDGNRNALEQIWKEQKPEGKGSGNHEA